MTGQWAGSTRRSRLPPDWAKTRARILARDHGICHVCGTGGANDVDHIRAGDDHSDTNLAPIHRHPCHAAKSAREGVEARLTRPPRQRKTEQHPGLKTPD